ncbi:MAG: NAD(P)/FAD-dependent oxidoreductase [Planctomycetes bacterium]|nr:NAD(P)/FAD-dependent oxidoreductase [Planctomycetota bacterium]
MKPKIVILGGGFGGAYCAQALEKAVRQGLIDVTLIDRHNYFVFYPLLVEAGTGSLHPRHAVVSIRNFTKAATFRMAETRFVDFSAQRVGYQLSGSDRVETVPYDHLVLALGSVSRLPEVPGLKEHAFEMKSLVDAVVLRDHAIRMLERAEACDDPEQRKAMLHFVVVGGNYTGVEAAGEFQVFLRQACKHYPSLKPGDCRVTLVEISHRILPALDEDLSAYAVGQLEKRGTRVLLDSSVRSIEKERVTFHTGETLATHTTIWCAGIAPNPFLSDLPLSKDPLGYLLCDADLRVTGHRNIWGIGDAAVNPDPRGAAYAPTAQHAVRQGAHLARNLLRLNDGKEALPFVYRSVGSLAALGCRTGAAKVFGMKLSGFPAWFLWRTVYLLKMPGLARKTRLALDWTLDLLFPRDIVQLGVHHHDSEK